MEVEMIVVPDFRDFFHTISCEEDTRTQGEEEVRHRLRHVSDTKCTLSIVEILECLDRVDIPEK